MGVGAFDCTWGTVEWENGVRILKAGVPLVYIDLQTVSGPSFAPPSTSQCDLGQVSPAPQASVPHPPDEKHFLEPVLGKPDKPLVLIMCCRVQ